MIEKIPHVDSWETPLKISTVYSRFHVYDWDTNLWENLYFTVWLDNMYWCNWGRTNIRSVMLQLEQIADSNNALILYCELLWYFVVEKKMAYTKKVPNSYKLGGHLFCSLCKRLVSVPLLYSWVILGWRPTILINPDSFSPLRADPGMHFPQGWIFFF